MVSFVALGLMALASWGLWSVSRTSTGPAAGGRPISTAPPARSEAAARQALQEWRARSLAALHPDGRWVLRLSSAYDGTVVPDRVAQDGSHTLRLVDILSIDRRLAASMARKGVATLLLQARDIGRSPSPTRAIPTWLVLADPGGLTSFGQASVACTELYPSVSGSDLPATCAPVHLPSSGTAP